MEISRELSAILTSVVLFSLLVIVIVLFTKYKARKEAKLRAINEHTTK